MDFGGCMQISRNIRETSVFVLTWDDIVRLYNTLASRLPKVTLSTKGVDGLTRAFEGLDELQGFRNPKKGEVVELHITARDQSFGQRCSLSFSSRGNGNVSFSVDAQEAEAIFLNEFYEDFRDSIRPWYSLPARINLERLFALGMISVLLFMSLGLYLTGRWGQVSFKGFSESFSTRDFFFSVLPWVVVMFVNSLKSRYFPMGVFCIGDALKRHQSLEVIRTVIIAAFVVSLTASFVTLLF
jgi:hypothetical protein